MPPDDLRVTILQNEKGIKSRKVQHFRRMSGLCMFNFAAGGRRQIWHSPVKMEADLMLHQRVCAHGHGHIPKIILGTFLVQKKSAIDMSVKVSSRDNSS